MAKPCLGYQSRGAAARGLEARGRSVREIVEAINAESPDAPVTPHSVRSWLWVARQAPVLPITLSTELCEWLDKAARARGTTAARLAHRLLSVVLDDNLINAILDDGDDA